MNSIFIDAANISPEALNERCANTMNTALNIRFTELGADYLKATMPVAEASIQPLGMLNGGASMALVEIVGSMAANLVVDRSRFVCFGLDINGNHVRPAFKGQTVSATARPIHIGSTTHVWEVRVEDEQNRLLCIGRITMAVRPLEAIK
ncbi:MAG: hotdog fold thioesterase [Bacteroidetes bacterium]|nr:hotdog fold thioesterase [Bacteroidota bacterium]